MARAAQNGVPKAPAASAKNAADRRTHAAKTSRSLVTYRSTAMPAMPGFRRHVLVTTAARHAERSAFFTPADDSGSMKLDASPTSSVRPSAARTQS